MIFLTLGPYVDIYVDSHRGFHLLATGGYAHLSTNPSNSVDGSNGFTLGVGAGYDWWVSDNWSLGVLARFQYAQMFKEDIAGTNTNVTIAPTIAFSFEYQ